MSPVPVPPESVIVVCIQRNDKMKPSLPNHERWSPQTREASAVSSLESIELQSGLSEDAYYQLKGGVSTPEESDQSILDNMDKLISEPII